RHGRAIDRKRQLGAFDQNDVFLVLEEAVNKRGAGSDPGAVHDIGTHTGAAAVAVVAALNLVTHADGSPGAGADGACDRRALGSVSLALAATDDGAFLVRFALATHVGRIAAIPSMGLFQRA